MRFASSWHSRITEQALRHERNGDRATWHSTIREARAHLRKSPAKRRGLCRIHGKDGYIGQRLAEVLSARRNPEVEERSKPLVSETDL